MVSWSHWGCFPVVRRPYDTMTPAEILAVVEMRGGFRPGYKPTFRVKMGRAVV